MALEFINLKLNFLTTVQSKNVIIVTQEIQVWYMRKVATGPGNFSTSGNLNSLETHFSFSAISLLSGQIMTTVVKLPKPELRQHINPFFSWLSTKYACKLGAELQQHKTIPIIGNN